MSEKTARRSEQMRDACRRYRERHRERLKIRRKLRSPALRQHRQREWQNWCFLNARASDARKGLNGTNIDVQFIRDEWQRLEGLCPYCHCKMHAGIGVNRQIDRDGVTVQRRDNTLAHTKQNCTLCCTTCNCDFRNVPHEVLLVHGRDLKSGAVRWCGSGVHAGLRLCHPSKFYACKTVCKACHNASH